MNGCILPDHEGDGEIAKRGKKAQITVVDIQELELPGFLDGIVEHARVRQRQIQGPALKIGEVMHVARCRDSSAAHVFHLGVHHPAEQSTGEVRKRTGLSGS